MQLTAIFLCVACLQVSAGVYAQKVTITENNVPLEKVFRKIQQQTGYSFIYAREDIRKASPVTINMKDADIQDVLNKCFAHQPLTYLIKNDIIVVRPKPSPPAVQAVPEQEIKREIKGQVTDAVTGAPLVGVTIQVKGTTLGTTTDPGGNFSIAVSEDDVLVFSYLGYTVKEVAVNGRTGLLVHLAPVTTGLNQLVVVGYGTQKKQDVTSAVSQITGDELRRTPNASLQNSLSGKLPGLFTIQRSGEPSVNGAANIYIRGISTYTNTSKQPLVLVDNVEYNLGQLFLIDPNEVKSVSILKDAAATAIYGIKGANGVILITTRRGRVGKPVIHLKTQVSVESPVKRVQVLDSYHTALLENEAYENDGLQPKFTEEDLTLFKNHQDPYGHPDVNWNDVLFNKSTLRTTYNLDISGGSERVQYFITLGYMRHNGYLRKIPYKGDDPNGKSASDVNNNYYAKRYRFRSNLDIKATSSLNFQLDITGTYEEENKPEFRGGGLQHIYEADYLNPYSYPVYNPDGSFGWANPRWGIPRGFNNVAGHVALGGYDRLLNDFMNVHLSGIQKLDVITPGLSLKGEIAYSSANTANKKMSRPADHFTSFYYDPEDSSYTPRNSNIYRIYPYNLSYSGQGNPNQRLNIQGSLNYRHAFGPHHVSGLLLFNQTSYTINANPPVNFRGYTFRMAYDYKHKYLLQVSGAYNGTSRFVTQERYNLFPAFSAGYNIAKEPFIRQALPFLDAFKIRGSYGWVGNDDIGISGDSYVYESEYDRDGYESFGETHNNVHGIVEGRLGNDDVTWETERKADVGLDFSLFKGKLSGSVDYFDNYRYNILTRRQTIPMYFGVTQGNLPPVNIGEVSNKGYEIELSYRDYIGKVGISVKGNVTFARNKILFRDEPPAKYPWQKSTGLPIGTMKQYVWTGTFYQSQKDIDTSARPIGSVQTGWLKYKDLNGDGVINTDDMAYVGNPNIPNTNIGLTLGVSYRGFNFSVLLQSAVNFDVSTGVYLNVPFLADMQPIHMNRWTPETASTATFPALTTHFAGSYMNPDGNLSTFWTVAGDYLRVRSAYLSYQLPKTVVEKVGIHGAQVFVNGYNLFTWSKALKKLQVDPEITTGSRYPGYPVAKAVNFGLNLTF